MQLISKECKYS